MSELIHYEYIRPGKRVMRFEQWLVEDRPDVKILLLERHEGPGLQVGPTTILERGAPAVWFVFPGAWFDVGRFHRADGTFTGWYANICTPVQMDGDVWSSTDLFLDYWMPAAGGGQWLDEHEFIMAIREGLVDHQQGARAANVRREIDRLREAGEWPPEVARDFTLTQARDLL